MSSFNRRLFCLAPLALAACGFTPVNAPGGTGSALRNAVQVNKPADRNAFLLTQHIESKIGRASSPRYSLSLNVTATAVGLGIDPEGNTDRFNLLGGAGYVLSDIESGQQVTSGTVNSFTGYSTTDSTVATLAAERDARERLMIILGDQIVARLLAASLTP